MVEQTIYSGCCPRCGGDDEELDAYDGPDGRPTARMRCAECGYEFELEQLWVLCD